MPILNSCEGKRLPNLSVGHRCLVHASNQKLFVIFPLSARRGEVKWCTPLREGGNASCFVSPSFTPTSQAWRKFHRRTPHFSIFSFARPGWPASPPSRTVLAFQGLRRCPHISALRWSHLSTLTQWNLHVDPWPICGCTCRFHCSRVPRLNAWILLDWRRVMRLGCLSLVIGRTPS